MVLSSALPIADLLLICYEGDVMASLSYYTIKKLKLFKHLNPTSRYLDDLLNIANPYFKGMVGRTYPPELQ